MQSNVPAQFQVFSFVQWELRMGPQRHPVIRIPQVPEMTEDYKTGHPHECSTRWVLPSGCRSGINAASLSATHISIGPKY